jgi:hypothetical protein
VVVRGFRDTWLPRLLFLLTVALALGLLGGVLLSPWLDESNESANGWERLVAVFAQDAVVRRTAVVSAVGLIVTACVFFRPWPRATDRPRNPPDNVVGA